MIDFPPQANSLGIRCLGCHASLGDKHGDACDLATPGSPVEATDLRFATETPEWLATFARQLAAHAGDPEMCSHLATAGHDVTMELHMMTWAPGLMLCGPCAAVKVPIIRDEGFLGQALCDACQLVLASGLVSFETGNLTLWAGLCVRCVRQARPDGELTQDSNHYAQAHHAIFGLAPAPACLGCSVGYGEPHAAACEIAACLITGRARLLCPEDHDHGFDRWGGARRGYLEAAELGWFAAIDPAHPQGPWAQVDSIAVHGAFPDLARVLDQAEWDPDRERFFPPAPLHLVDRAIAKLPNGDAVTVTVVSAQQLHHGHWHTRTIAVTDPDDAQIETMRRQLLDDLGRDLVMDHQVAA